MFGVIKQLLLLLSAAGIVLSSAYADGWAASSGKTETQTTNKSSANYNKTGRFLPGEKVVTPTGQTMKVWSTEGPVPVSRPPEPFEDREKTVVDDVGVILDPDDLRGRRKNHSVHQYQKRRESGR